MELLARAEAIMKREFPLFAYGDGHWQKEIEQWRPDHRNHHLSLLWDSMLVALRRGMPWASENELMACRRFVLFKTQEKINRM